MSPIFLEELLLHVLPSDNHPVLDGAALVSILQKLTEYEIEEGGPYSSLAGGTLDTTDFGVNLVISLFLKIYDVRLPKLESFISSALSSEAQPTSLAVDNTILKRLIRLYKGNKDDTTVVMETENGDVLEEAFLEKIYEKAERRFASLPDAFSTNALSIIKRTVRGNPDKQMSLMAYYVRKALGTKGAVFSDETIADLGLANVFFWTAFIVYDDFWDEDEAAEPRFLPIANLFARHYVDFFLTFLPSETGFKSFFNEMMDMLDSANEWEMLHCRVAREGDEILVLQSLPSYGDYDLKFYPAAGHIFGPMAMLAQLGCSTDSSDGMNLISYFKHYLIAMQVNDDMHDWKEDLGRGHLSCAVVAILESWKKKHPDRHRIHLVNDMPELENIFWFEVLAPLCTSVLALTHQAHSALHSVTVFEDYAPLERFIERNRSIAEQALSEHKVSVGFLDALHSQERYPHL